MIPKKIIVDLTEFELTLLIWSLEESGYAFSDNADALQAKLRVLRGQLQKVPNLEE